MGHRTVLLAGQSSNFVFRHSYKNRSILSIKAHHFYHRHQRQIFQLHYCFVTKIFQFTKFSDFYYKNASCENLSIYNSDFYYKMRVVKIFQFYNSDFYCKNASCKRKNSHNSDFCSKNPSCKRKNLHNSGFCSKNPNCILSNVYN